MANIVIDPIIVATPPDGADKTEVEAWLKHLQLWLSEALAAPFTWLHCREASDQLVIRGRFPNFASLRQLQQQYHLDINPSQIAREVNAFFLNETHDIHAYMKSQPYDLEVESTSIIVAPEQFSLRQPEEVRAIVHDLLTHCCACKHLDIAPGRDLHVATLKLSGSAKEITVAFTLVLAIPDIPCNTAKLVTQTFPLLITPDDLYPLINVIDTWAKGEQAVIYTIKQQCAQTRTGIASCAFTLGPSFLQSVRERGLDTNEILLNSFFRAATDVITDQAKSRKGYKLHEFRENEAPDSKQLVRPSDGARAWRLMLQQHGVGARLHYWQIPTDKGSVIEFANIGRESERKII